MTDPDAFKIGGNVATTPGKVMFRNDLIELLQFDPTTDDVVKTPLLIVPPWINKYYILDLREKNGSPAPASTRGRGGRNGTPGQKTPPMRWFSKENPATVSSTPSVKRPAPKL